jgi:hypothetical protein
MQSRNEQMSEHDAGQRRDEGTESGHRSRLLTPVMEETLRQPGDLPELADERVSLLQEKDRSALWSRLS